MRKKVREQHHHDVEVAEAAPVLPEESPRWLAPVMVLNFLIGLFWIVVFLGESSFNYFVVAGKIKFVKFSGFDGTFFKDEFSESVTE